MKPRHYAPEAGPRVISHLFVAFQPISLTMPSSSTFTFSLATSTRTFSSFASRARNASPSKTDVSPHAFSKYTVSSVSHFCKNLIFSCQKRQQSRYVTSKTMRRSSWRVFSGRSQSHFLSIWTRTSGVRSARLKVMQALLIRDLWSGFRLSNHSSASRADPAGRWKVFML